MTVIVERRIRILNSDGWYHDVGPSDDGDMVEVKYSDDGGNNHYMSLGKEDAVAVAKAMLEIAEGM